MPSPDQPTRAPRAPVPTDPEGRPLYPADIADLDPAKAFAAGLHLPVRVEDTAAHHSWAVVDAGGRCVAWVFFGTPPLDFASSESARGIATAIAKSINQLGCAI